MASSARRARASSSASRCILSFSSFASRISSFWRARASASMRRASEVAAFIVWDAQRLRRKNPATAPPTAATTATVRMSRGSIFGSSHPTDRGSDVRDAVVGPITLGEPVPWARWALRGPRSSRFAGRAPPRRHVVRLLRSLRLVPPRVNRGQPRCRRRQSTAATRSDDRPRDSSHRASQTARRGSFATRDGPIPGEFWRPRATSDRVVCASSIRT